MTYWEMREMSKIPAIYGIGTAFRIMLSVQSEKKPQDQRLAESGSACPDMIALAEPGPIAGSC